MNADRFKLTDRDFERRIPGHLVGQSSVNAGLQPSPQQAAVYDWVKNGRGNLIVEAVAGAGKTTTIIEACTLMTGSVAFTAFNKAIASEIGERLRARGSGAFSGTFHSFGYRAWKRVYPNVKTERDKIEILMDGMDVEKAFRTFVRRAVSLAKQGAVGVLTNVNDDERWRRIVEHHELDELLSGSDVMSEIALEKRVEQGISLAQVVLAKSISVDHELIDFDDMIYAPLIHNAKMYQNDWLLVDEVQDTNPARRALAKKMLRPGGRAIFVGDPHQAIYGFTGADNDAMSIITREFACQKLPLTVTYRCPKKVVAFAKTWVSHIEAHETAPEGELKRLSLNEFMLASAQFKEIAPTDPTVAVLCRVTKPIVQMAFDLIKRGVRCYVEGRDIGESLMSLANKWKVKSLSALITKLDKYRERETEKFMAKGQEKRADSINDKVDTLKVLIDSLPPGSTLIELRELIDRMFGDTVDGERPKMLVLSTVHKAKGREWEEVYLLGREKYMPSRFARQEWQLQQEYNLIYVAVTRAKKVLVEVVEPITETRRRSGR